MPFQCDGAEMTAMALEVKPLRYIAVLKAASSATDAYKDDPVTMYMRYTPDANRSICSSLRFTILMSFQYAEAVSDLQAFTINHGDATVTRVLPHKSQAKGGLMRLLKAAKPIIGWLAMAFNRLCDSEEQRRRRKEWLDKLEKAIQESLCNQENMVFLRGLYTAPVMQGRGYGTALVKAVTAEADAQSRSTWLVSSNVDNAGFYEKLGFCTVGEFTLGEDNPTWTAPPVVARIMARSPLQLGQLRTY